MLNKSAVREYFIQKANDLVVPQELADKLEKLTVFTDDKKQMDMKLFWDALFKSVISMDSINYAEVYIEQKQHLDDLNTIAAIQTWAKAAWKKGIEAIDINKIIIAYILVDRLFLLPDTDLDWTFNEETKEKLKKYLKQLPKIVTIDVSTDISERASFADKKYHIDYKEAVEKNDHRGMFTFFSAMAHGVGFHTQFDYFNKITAKLSVIVDPNIFAENLSKFTPYGTRYYLEYLDSMQIAEALATYNSSEPFPLLAGIIKIVNPHGNNQFDNSLIEDYKFIENAVLIVEKITQTIGVPNIYRYITDCSNISMNELWHCIFSVFIAKNYLYHRQYLEAIDFSYNVGEHSFNGFISCSYNPDDLDDFSCKIYNKYFHSLIGKSSNRLINFTSYFKYLSQAIFAQSDKSHQKYLENLEQVSIELKRGIYSWKNGEWNMLFTKWMFWLLSSKDFIERVAIDRNALKTTYELINDMRITDAMQMDATSLINLLENPGQTGSITLPVAGLYGDDKITISWDLSTAVC